MKKRFVVFRTICILKHLQYIKNENRIDHISYNLLHCSYLSHNLLKESSRMTNITFIYFLIKHKLSRNFDLTSSQHNLRYKLKRLTMALCIELEKTTLLAVFYLIISSFILCSLVCNILKRIASYWTYYLFFTAIYPQHNPKTA